MIQVDVLIVGGGPAGLAAAIALRQSGIKSVLVVEREKVAGGVPRHCHHTGFGMKDMRRILAGPDYARRYVQRAEAVGVEIATATMVTDWLDDMAVQTTSAGGIERIQAGAVVLATGCRERPRSARLVPGSRPEGIFTTGALQQWVYLYRHKVGRRAVVVGAEHVSFSAVMTLKHAGVEVAAMVTDQPHHQSFFAYKLITADRWRIPIYTGTRLTGIKGHPRLTGVEIASLDGSYNRREISCDTLVFTGDWIPDNELAAAGNIALAMNNRGPQVDSQLRTSSPGVFAVGNLIHATETADFAALNGRFVANPVLNYLETGQWRSADLILIKTGGAVHWVSPQLIDPNIPVVPNRHLSVRVKEPLRGASIAIWQGDRLLWRRRYRRLMPNLPVHIPAEFLKKLHSTENLTLTTA
jgi:thioredoxin reductase